MFLTGQIKHDNFSGEQNMCLQNITSAAVPFKDFFADLNKFDLLTSFYWQIPIQQKLRFLQTGPCLLHHIMLAILAPSKSPSKSQSCSSLLSEKLKALYEN